MSISKYSKHEYVTLFHEVSAMDYRQRLRALREDHDLSQAEAGQIIHKSQQGYSHIENGRAELKIEDLAVLCRYYGVSADYVIGLTDRPDE